MSIEKITSMRLAEILGVQPSAISHIISGRNKPGFEFLSNFLSAFPGINPRWLMLGEEPMYIKSSSPLDHDTDTAVTADHPISLFELNNNIQENNDEGNSRELESLPPTLPNKKSNGKKEVKKIILLYSDGSFDSYHQDDT